MSSSSSEEEVSQTPLRSRRQGSINQGNLGQVMEKLYDLRLDISKMKAEEHTLKGQLLDYMEEKKTSSMEVEGLRAVIRNQQREIMQKQCVPKDVWDRYSKKIQYSTLTISERRRK